MSTRHPWQGMLTVARLNWPYYVAASAILIAALCAVIREPSLPWRLGGAAAALGAAWFLAGSLGVSHLVYDRSDLYRWGWLKRALAGASACEVIFAHAGFDDASASLRAQLAGSSWRVLDHFDAKRMTEASIRRARVWYPPAPGTISAPYDRWPTPDDSADVILGFLAIHELRSEAERTAWFSQAHRCLRTKGRIILVEHTRDLANFLAFGPGFVHFHSPASWRRCWEKAALRLCDEFRVSPWVRVFVLEKS